MLVPTSLRELLETSDVVGNIRFTHPTLYVFPGGQGDAALFGINGFNMLGKFNLEILQLSSSHNLLQSSSLQSMAASIARPASGTLHGTWIAWMRS